MPVHGVPEFEAAVDRLIASLEPAVKAAVAEAAHLIEAEAKSRAPVQTGTLRRSITVEGPKAEGLAIYSARVGPTVIYGRRIELGYHGPDSLGRVYNQAGQPYMRPAVDTVGGQLLPIFIRHVGAAIRSV